MQNKPKSVHFASHNSEHTISSSSTPQSQKQTLLIEDETQNPPQLRIPQKSMKLLMDCSNLRTEKQLTKLAKDGVIFVRAAPHNNNAQRTNALKLRNIMFKLLEKYEFAEKVPHPNYDTSKKSVEDNGWIPRHAIKPKKECIKAVFVGSVGINEPEWRSFWQWSDNSNSMLNNENTNNEHISTFIAPESQLSNLSLSTTPPVLSHANNRSDVRFDELTDEDKKSIYKWAVDKEQTEFIKNRISHLFKNYASNDCTLAWGIEVVNPLWFRIQSIGSILHSDIPYIFGHTNLLTQISGQKLLISGIDMKNKETYIGKKSKMLKQKLSVTNNNNNNNKCPLCSYIYSEGDTEEKLENQQKTFEQSDNNNGTQDSLYHNYCESCCDSRYGLYTVWTALDHFDTPFNSGSMVFALGSHSKYKGFYEATLNNHSVPTGYSKKSVKEKQYNIRWGYVNNIKPGDMFIFNIKTLHASSASTDGYLRARVDMRVAVKPSQKRYVKELNEIKIANERKDREHSISSHLGLSQLCSQVQPHLNNNESDHNENENESPEFNTSVSGNIKSKHLSFSDNNECENKTDVLKRSASTNDIDMIDGGNGNDNRDNILKLMDNISKNDTVSIQDLPTQADDSPDLVMNENENENDANYKMNVESNSNSGKQRERTLTPQDINMDNDNNNNSENIIQTPVIHKKKKEIIPSPLSITHTPTQTVNTPQSVASVQGTPIIQQRRNDNNNNNTNYDTKHRLHDNDDNNNNESMMEYTVPETQFNDNNINKINNNNNTNNKQRQQRHIEQQIPGLENQSAVIHNKHSTKRYHPNSNNSNNNNNNNMINVRKRMFSNMDTRPLSQTSNSSQHNEKEKENNNNNNDQPPNKKQKISHNIINNNNNNSNNYASSSGSGVYMNNSYGMNMNMNSHSHMISDMKINNIRHFTTMSDEELCRNISQMRNKVKKTYNALQTQMNESLDLMEVANERYLYTKQKEKQQRERANHFQQKNENLQKKVIENHNMLFKMFEQ